MSIRQLCFRVLAFLITRALALYFKTLRIEVRGQERIREELIQSSTGSVFVFWHDSLIITPLIEWIAAIQPISILISNSRDGDIPTEIGKQYRNISVVRVKASSRTAALLQSCEILENRGCILITPDGPRGPRHKIKPGALYAAQKARASIIPVVYVASRESHLSSWDRFRLPWPFARMIMSYLDPIECPEEGDLTKIQATIENLMDAEEQKLAKILASK